MDRFHATQRYRSETGSPSVPEPHDGGVMWDAARTGIEIIAAKWVLAIIAELAQGPRRHNELARAVCLDHKRLARALQRTQEANIVYRQRDLSRQQIHVWYALTRRGRDLLPILAALGLWNQQPRSSVPAPIPAPIASGVSISNRTDVPPRAGRHVSTGR